MGFKAASAVVWSRASLDLFCFGVFQGAAQNILHEHQDHTLKILNSCLNLVVQCPLGFATLGKAAALALATSRALTDLRQYINSDLGFSDLEI